MNQKVLDFLQKERVCALTTAIDGGSLHCAAMHFSFNENPLTLYFSTDKTSRKCTGWLEKGKTSAAVVIGLSEENWLTMSLEGEIKVLADPEEIAAVKKIHYARHPNSAEFEADPNAIFLAFTPVFWRYIDYNTKPLTIYDNQTKV